MPKLENTTLTQEQFDEVYKKAPRYAYGVDIGGSGIKGAFVDLKKGKFASQRLRIPTPELSTPVAIVETIAKLLNNAKPSENTQIGITFPGVIIDGVIHLAANLDKSLIGVNLNDLILGATKRTVATINDADAAGYGEFLYGAGANDKEGLFVVLTLGTGIGSALIFDGRIIKNTEFGHFQMHGKDAEKYAASSVKEKLNLTYEQYAKRLSEYVANIDLLLRPKTIILGGGISQNYSSFLPLIEKREELNIIPAKLRNKAGIIGAAAFASRQ